MMKHLNTKNEKLGYKIPENYFEGLEKKLKSQVDSTSTPIKSLFNRKKIVAALAIAASIIVLLGLLFINSNKVALDANYADLEYLFEEEINQDMDEFTLLDVYVLDEEKLEINNVYQKIILED